MAGLTVGSLVQVREAPFTTMFAPFVIPVRFVIVIDATICVEVVIPKAGIEQEQTERTENRKNQPSNRTQANLRSALAIFSVSSVCSCEIFLFIKASALPPEGGVPGSPPSGGSQIAWAIFSSLEVFGQVVGAVAGVVHGEAARPLAGGAGEHEGHAG